MIRVGIFTGKIYDKTVPPEFIDECTLVFIDNSPPTEDMIKEWLKKYQTGCIGCYGCEEARKVLRDI